MITGQWGQAPCEVENSGDDVARRGSFDYHGLVASDDVYWA